ncbi:uncharacterized protein LOC134234179 [Saccostrea cucullata]|uniref:uncharacterized protein LOC134234179 n=1 Tax=Saccostrea cuccullata TaxID=36930 RepID=UPI002ED53764
MAYFEAKTGNGVDTGNWPVSLMRQIGDTTDLTDLSIEKYHERTSRRPVIQNVEKDDQGEYQALISREKDGRNIKIQNPPNLEIINVSSEIDCVKILYSSRVENIFPESDKIEWTKDGEPLTTNTKKYKGGGITDDYLKILSPSENDSGEYTCRVFNDAGSNVKRIVLAAPSVEIGKDLKVPLGGQIKIEPVIKSCPSQEKVSWQKSKSQDPDNFMNIDINDSRYFESSVDPENPVLVIKKTSYSDILYYRLEVTNRIGKSTSNAVRLKLVIDPSSVFTNLETNIANQCVTIVCKFSLSNNSPEVTNIIWTKDKECIDILGSQGKYAGGSIVDPSLVIHRVNSNDVGEYQCYVLNAVGSMASNPIHLGNPIVQNGNYEKDEETDKITCTVVVESIPDALTAEWRVQQTPEEDFQPIDVHDSTYRGSTVSLPQPVLIVHEYSKKQGQQFQISVSNFIGETKEVIIDQGAIIEDALSKCNSLREVLGILIQEGLFSNCDVILVQYVLRRIGCVDLYKRCYKYAKDWEALCFFESQPENGYTAVRFHICGNFKEYSKEDIYSIRDTVANMLECSKEYVVISGIEHDKSFVVVLSIKEEYTFALLSNAQDILKHLCFLNVDYLVCGEIVIRKGHTSKEKDVELAKWKDEDKLYQETHSFHKIMEKVRKQGFVTFVGGPGSGKSATAHHIALMLRSEGYEIIPIKHITEIKGWKYFEVTNNRKVFVVDDVVGVFGLQITKLDYLAYLLKDNEYEMAILSIFRFKTLLTCREAVYNESLSYDPSFRWNESVIDLNSSEYALDDNDKILMMENYGLRSELLSPSLLTSASHMFPLLCKLFSKEEKFRNFGSKFFTNPDECIITELDEMQAKTKFFYATLALCIMNEKLSEDILKDKRNTVFNKMKNSVLKNLELQTCTSTFKFVEALSAMEGAYTRKSGTEYTFIHDYAYELCAYHYGQQFPAQILQYMSSNYIANKVKLQKSEAISLYKSEERGIIFYSDQSDKGDKKNVGKSNETEESFDLCIRLSEDQYPLLAERLYRDIEEMELDDVFTNEVLKNPKMCKAFIDVLEKKSYGDIKSLFLYERFYPKILERTRYFSNWRERMKHTVKVISWVVFYGHHHILQYIVGITEKHEEEKSELFYGAVKYRFFPAFSSRESHYADMLSNDIIMLLLSCYSGNLETVKIVLKYVCKDAIKNPMFRHEIFDKIEFLHLQIKSKTSWRCTPLAAACKGGYMSIVQELIKAGASINLADENRRTALITASDEGHLRIVQELIEVGADLNVCDYYGNTPLSIACKKGHFNIMQIKLKTS